MLLGLCVKKSPQNLGRYVPGVSMLTECIVKCVAKNFVKYGVKYER